MHLSFLPAILFSTLSVCTTNAQNVGIGTTTPAEKLHVAGNIKADTLKPAAFTLTPNAAAGKILTSDGVGNASWQASAATSAVAPGNVGYGVWGDCATNGNISEYQPGTDSLGAAGDYFGRRVAISGNFAIVGAYVDDIGANPDQGSASIYQYNGTNWVFMQKLTDATGAAADYFGISVSISGNFAIVGSYADDVGLSADQGSAIIYQYNGTSWVQTQRITDATGAAGDLFGTSVSMSGNMAIIGAENDDVGANADQGSASIYQYNGSSWVLVQKLTDPTGAASDNLGYSLSINGNFAMAGAAYDNVGANADQGSAIVFQYNGANWVFFQKITDPTGAADDNFGISVSISGNYAIIGAIYTDVGANTNQGSANIYQYNSTSWILMQKLTDPAGGLSDYFGGSVSISGNYALVGANDDKVGNNAAQGSASIYIRIGGAWQRLQYVTDPAGNFNESFGGATAIDGSTKRFLIGEHGFNSYMGKVIFGKIN